MNHTLEKHCHKPNRCTLWNASVVRCQSWTKLCPEKYVSQALSYGIPSLDSAFIQAQLSFPVGGAEHALQALPGNYSSQPAITIMVHEISPEKSRAVPSYRTAFFILSTSGLHFFWSFYTKKPETIFHSLIKRFNKF